MDAIVGAFEKHGFVVLDEIQLSDNAVAAFVRSLEPWADAQMAPNRGHKSYWEGKTRLAASNALLQLATHGNLAERTLDFKHLCAFQSGF